MKIIAAFTVGLALAGVLCAVPAEAQNARSFVSGHGLDTNACTLAAPCRTFAAAFAATNAGGEIDVLDPAGYGSLTINKAISIVNDGVGTSSILVPSGGVGITINALAGDAVSLRGLTIEGAGLGQTGIHFINGRSLTIENSVVRHVVGDGIDFNPSATSDLAVSNTLVADNTAYGIFVLPTGTGAVTAVFNRIEVNNNGTDGILVDGQNSTGTIAATVSDSVATRHGNTGFDAETVTGKAPTTLVLFHCVSANNNTGLEASGPGAILRAAQSMVTGNSGASWSASSNGLVQSYGDNYIDGNGPNNMGTLTSITRQ